jgi:hypothetical protein
MHSDGAGLIFAEKNRAIVNIADMMEASVAFDSIAHVYI